MEKLKDTIFYSLEKAIKSYRQFAQRNIKSTVEDITIDQWLILKTLLENPDISQTELAEQVFKDVASITRIIDLLVSRNYLQRKIHKTDRRRYKLEITDYAKKQFDGLFAIVNQNRKTALQGISKEEINQLHQILLKIITNCQTNSNNEKKLHTQHSA